MEKARGGFYSIIPDQIEAGTYMAAVAAAGGRLLVKNIIPKHLDCISAKLVEMGGGDSGGWGRPHRPPVGQAHQHQCKDHALPRLPHRYAAPDGRGAVPGRGTSILNEGVWDNRYRYADEFRRMGANIQVNGKVAVIEGFTPSPAPRSEPVTFGRARP